MKKKMECGFYPTMTRSDLIEMDQILSGAFAYHRSLREKFPVAKRIKFPSLPSVFTESLVIAAAQHLLGVKDGWTVRPGGKRCDVLIQDPQGAEMTVEVKATGERGTLELKEKDIECDVIVWIAFGTYFVDPGSPFLVYVVRQPSTYPKLSGAVARVAKLSTFVQALENRDDFIRGPFTSVQELLG